MPVNRYQTPAEAQFINTYVPIPFEEMMKVGLLKQARIDEDLAKQEQMITEIGTFATMPGADERRREEILANVRKDIGDIPGQLGYLDWRQGFANVRSKYASSPEMLDLKANAKQYAELVKAKQEALEKGVPPANRYELESKISEAVDLGTKGLKEKYGTGQLSLSSYTPYVDTYDKIQEYVNDVDLSTITTESTDGSGRYDITSTTGGRTLNALLAPFGLTMKKGVDREGNAYFSPDFTDPEKGSANFIRDLINKDWGQQYITNAKYELKTDSVTDEVIGLAAEEAMQEINKAVKERVVVRDSSTYSVNAYGYKLWADKTDNWGIPLTSKGVTVIEGSEFKDISSIRAAAAKAKDLSDDAEKDLTELKRGVRSFPIQNEKGEIISYEYKKYGPGDPIEGGVDVTQEMRDRIRTRDEFLNKLKGIENYEAEAKKQAAVELGIDPSSEPSNAIKNKAISLAIQSATIKVGYEVIKDLVEITPLMGGNPTQIPAALKEVPGVAGAILEEEYYKKLDMLDPLTRETNKILKLNSKNRSIELNLETFADEKSNKRLENWFDISLPSPTVVKGRKAGEKTISSGQVYRNAATNQPLSDKEYAEVALEEGARYKGFEFNLNTGAYDVWFKAPIKNPKNPKEIIGHKDIKTEAPDGLIQMLALEGRINDAETFVAAKISKPSLGAEGVVTFNMSKSQDPRYDIYVKHLTSFERLNSAQTSSGNPPEYKISFKENSAFSELPYVSNYQALTPSEAVAKIVDYAIKVDEIENNINLQIPRFEIGPEK